MSTPNDPPRTVVVMARGLGTRMRAEAPDAVLDERQAAVAATGMKSMIDVGRPFLDHVLGAAVEAGVSRAVLVIGPEHDEIRRYYGELPRTRLAVEFAVQAEPRGTADAMLAAADSVGDDRFVLLNSDNYYPPEALRALAHTSGEALVGFTRDGLVTRGNIPPERVAAFALLERSGDRLASIVEKPDEETVRRLGDAALVSMNCYAFTPRIFDYARRIAPSARGEYELPDAVRAAVADGVPVTVVPSDAGVLDMSYRADVSAVAAALADHEVTL